MADVPAVPLSKAREELVTWRQNAYKVRTEAAIKIQRWFRQGYRTASDMERLTEQQHNKVVEDESLGSLSTSSSDHTGLTEPLEEDKPVKEESSYERISLSELTQEQFERVRKIREGLNQPMAVRSSNQQKKVEAKVQHSSNPSTNDMKRNKEQSKIPVRKSKSKRQFASESKSNETKDPKLQQTRNLQGATVDGGPVKKQFPRVKARQHDRASSSKALHPVPLASLDNQLQSGDTSTSTQSEHVKGEKTNLKSSNIKTLELNVKNGDNSLKNKLAVAYDTSSTSVSSSIDALDINTQVESIEDVSSAHLWQKEVRTIKKSPVISSRKTKTLIPLPQKKLARQKSYSKVKKLRKKTFDARKSKKSQLVDVGVQTDDSDSCSSSPYHVHTSLTSQSEQWSNPPRPLGHSLSPQYQGAGSYSNVYAVKKQRRKNVIRALQTPICKPFEKKATSGYLQKFKKNNKLLSSHPSSIASSPRLGFSKTLMESSSLLPRNNLLPRLRINGFYHDQQLPRHHDLSSHLTERSYLDSWTQDDMMLPPSLEGHEQLLYQRDPWRQTSMSSNLNYWRRSRRTL